MKKNFIFSIGLCLIVTFMMMCTPQQSEKSEETSVVEETHPLGQASVVDDVSDKNILQVAAGSQAHTTLVAAVQAAQIENVLVNAGPLTVFAPNNGAFDALPEGTVDNLLKPENKSQLATILTRHAAPGSYDIEGLKREATKGRKIYTATGDYLEVVVDGDKITVGGAEIVATIPASNGVIHVVNKVILPE
ncbi:fasciclin domain-containing protein [Fulvivirga lutimaris]|uniref:fasciclin domain-containing protein n=1 Tax=Fulvivirga lutimaris TaxID=1819566 RepID=UPI0012BD2094|nr:fasciclin domain-containing protein [Fulvivirga lutimaris]MTI40450.1 fasciclin domain-containing protein [Fulvivirga lutimaris]